MWQHVSEICFNSISYFKNFRNNAKHKYVSLAIYRIVEFLKSKARLQEQNLIEFENQNSEVISMFEVQFTYLFWVESQISAHVLGELGHDIHVLST